MNFLEFSILLAPIYISFYWLLILLIVGIKQKDQNKKYLSFFMLNVLVATLAGIAFFKQFYTFYSAIYIPTVFFALAQFPSLYIYFFVLTSEKYQKRQIVIHFLFPLIAMLSAIIIHIFILNWHQNIVLTSDYLAGHLPSQYEFKIAYYADRIYKDSFILFALLYTWLINKRVQKHRKKLDNYFSNTELLQLNWVKTFNILLFLTLIAGVSFHASDRSFFIENPLAVIIIYSVIAIFYGFIGYKGSKQIIIYATPPQLLQEKNHTPTNNNTHNLENIIDELMKNQKLYLQHDLSLPRLATLVGVNRSYLSKFINDYYGVNFKQFVNTYRLKEVEQLLHISLQKENINITDIAFDCGFNSYDTFYRCFKKTYEMSVSDYLKKAKQTQLYPDKVIVK